ncbi:hypothetical protein [Natrialba sp. SSL1]|uniref:hypothetical protein n=1 Tax=Natrialba sp. SSL1 TaxID=1869245 RepID=UPI0008F8DF5F|nr:hypothetical protein [Natrialba sp. SSL1]OIB56606.1 hypothetical protein BBD46_16590 [Natrialba sp. SSL1]
MTTHRWTSSTRLKRHDTGETIAPGEEFEPTDSELRAYGNQIERVEENTEPAELTEREREVAGHFGEDPDPETSADEDGSVAFDKDAWFEDHDGYQDRIETVESGVVDDVLDKIKATERSEKVIDAVEVRHDELDDE